MTELPITTPTIIPDYKRSMDFGTHLTASNSNNQYISWATPAIAKDVPVQFASVLAHEVRNPLTNINLSVELLASAIQDKDLQIYLDIIMRSSVRINELVKELLKYQEADDVLAESNSVHQLLDEVLEMARDRIKLKNIRIIKEYSSHDYSIVFHKPKMKLALTNIIVNAVDAMTRDKGELRIITKSVGNMCVVEIEDNGCGMSPGNIDNIFKPFFTNKPGGLGLGLATTHDILLANRVGVVVGSTEGEGTKFTLSFEKKYVNCLFNN